MKHLMKKAVKAAVFAALTTLALTAFASAEGEMAIGAGCTTGTSLRMRSEPNTSSAIVTTLNKSVAVALLDDSVPGWYKINYNGSTGYVSSDYLILDQDNIFTTYGRVPEGCKADGVTEIAKEDLLYTDADFLIPAALEGQITADNADRVKAKYIVEGANGPTSYEADQILNAKGKIVVPDILANAGGVIVSYFEWVQNLQSLSWSLEEVNNKLADILLKAFDEVYGLTEERGYPMRTSAYIIALRRLVKTKKIRGIFP